MKSSCRYLLEQLETFGSKIMMKDLLYAAPFMRTKLQRNKYFEDEFHKSRFFVLRFTTVANDSVHIEEVIVGEPPL